MQNPNCKYGGLCGKSECITILLKANKTRPLLVAAYGCNGMKNYCTICWMPSLLIYALQISLSSLREGRISALTDFKFCIKKLKRDIFPSALGMLVFKIENIDIDSFIWYWTRYMLIYRYF